MITEKKTFDIFICHAEEDKESIASPIAAALGNRKITYWIDVENVLWGDNIVMNINHAIQNSLFVLVIVSDSFLNKLWAKAEFSAALSVEISKNETMVLPLFCGDKDGIQCLRDRLPLLHAKMFQVWRNDPANIADLISVVVQKKTLHLNCREFIV